jgi:DNA modification methylase
MASGTTAVVAKKLNRHFVGIELNSKYIEITNRRLKRLMGG